MKKKYLSMAIAATLSLSILSTSCIGSFSLTNKLLNWNRQVGDKFVNELVFFAFWVLPVYEVSCLADVLVLNSIEFWSGENPVAENSKIIKASDGRDYLVETDSKGYTITNADGEVMRFDFNDSDKSWNVTVGDETYLLMTYVDDNHVALPAADGTSTIVELSESGVMAYRDMANPFMMAIAK